MKKFIFSGALLLLFFSTIFSQAGQMLDERIAEAVARNLPEWKPLEPAKPFKDERNTYSSVIRARWRSRNSEAEVRLNALESSNVNKKFDFSHPFLLRGVIPPNRKIENLGDSALLVETARSVEIAFYKANVYAVLTVAFPDARSDKTAPHYYARAPQAAVERTLALARVIADRIDDEKFFTACSNNFYRREFPLADSPDEKLYAAISNADLEAIKSLIARDADANRIFPDGDAPLHLAVRHGCPKTVKTLVEARAGVDIKNRDGATPLMLAANFGDLELIKYFVSAGADVRAKDYSGRSAVFYVVALPTGHMSRQIPVSTERKVAVLKYLAERKVDINEKDASFGDTPLLFLLHDYCLENMGCRAFVDTLLDSGADVNAVNKKGETALIKAASRFDSTVRNDFIKLFLARGADVNHKDNNGLSALGYVMKDKKLHVKDVYFSRQIAETIRLLEDAGAVE